MGVEEYDMPGEDCYSVWSLEQLWFHGISWHWLSALRTWNQLPAGWVAYSTAEGHVFYYNQSNVNEANVFKSLS